MKHCGRAQRSRATQVSCTSFMVTFVLHWSTWLSERNEALPSYVPASSRTCQGSLLLLHAITAKRVALSNKFTHAAGPFITGRPCARSWAVRTHSVFSAPLGTKVIDVQFGRRVDLCHSPSTLAGRKQGRRYTSSVRTRGQQWIVFIHRSSSRTSSTSRISRSSGALFPGPRSSSRWASSPL